MGENEQQEREFEDFYGPGLGGRVILTNPAPFTVEWMPAAVVVRRPFAPILPQLHKFDVTAFKRFHTPANQLISLREDAKDKWHVDRTLFVPLACSVEAPSITLAFAPTHGPCTIGVALTELELSRGLPDPRKPISLRSQGPRVINLVFTPLVVEDGAGKHITLRAFAKRIAMIFCRFIKNHGDEYVPPVGRRGWRLGEGGIGYEQLRLLEVFSEDGENFHARMGVVPLRTGLIIVPDAIRL
ncbi:hypothetical protein DFH08DRAFT_957782 [Mycena albidolilacea]|uniref:Uncharacterized protein n=1 Tax=Mycena albidolilacea TaxID=1033008 RepID=A0AAD7A7R4_9AGAR|nr:hypothetical protein DFH08DRAFT_957782 [Mycena albidolilacea]